jgi:hypothetical protein
MRNLILAAIVYLIAFAVPAHAGLFGEDPKMETDYAPASALIAHGAVQIGTFTYLPAVSGKLKSYEVDNPTLTDILMTRDVSDVVRESLLKEFRFVGIKIQSGPTLSGDIREFRFSDQFVSLSIHYSVKNPEGHMLYEGEKAVKERLGSGNVSPFDNVMTKSFEALLRDPEFIRSIDGEIGGLALPESSAHSIPFTYVPSSAFIADGSVAIDKFDYAPSATGKIEPDQIPNTAIGNIHLDQPVASYLAAAILKEFRLTGVNVESKTRFLSGTVVKLSCDDLGTSATWTLDVRYVVKDQAGNAVYDGEKITTLVTQKFLLMLNSLLRRNIETLLLDPAFLEAIGSSNTAKNIPETVVPSDGWHWVEWSGYGPRSALVAHGDVSVGAFSYPVATGKMEPTEIPNTALLKTLRADKPIAELMHDLALNELRSTGISVRSPKRFLTGEILKYKIDDIASPEEWDIAVHFEVKDNNGISLYSSTKAATPTNDPHTMNFLEMKVVIEELISDPAFIAAIS